MKLAIASGKGGTGKTTVATNLAMTLAHHGQAVAYVDCDVEAPNGHLFLHQLQVLGVVENLSGFACPHCGKTTDLFKSGGGEALAQEMGVPFLGKVPLDPQVVDSGDAGTPFVQRFGGSPTAHAFEDIVRPILLRIKASHSSPPPRSSSPESSTAKL